MRRIFLNWAAFQYIDEIVATKMRSSNQRAARTRSIFTWSNRGRSHSLDGDCFPKPWSFDPAAVTVESTSTSTTASRSNYTTNNNYSAYRLYTVTIKQAPTSAVLPESTLLLEENTLLLSSWKLVLIWLRFFEGCSATMSAHTLQSGARTTR